MWTPSVRAPAAEGWPCVPVLGAGVPLSRAESEVPRQVQPRAVRDPLLGPVVPHLQSCQHRRGTPTGQDGAAHSQPGCVGWPSSPSKTSPTTTGSRGSDQRLCRAIQAAPTAREGRTREGLGAPAAVRVACRTHVPRSPVNMLRTPGRVCSFCPASIPRPQASLSPRPM